MFQPKTNEKIKELFLDILERHHSYCTDDLRDRTMLAQRIAEDLTIFDFNDIVKIAKAFFPECEVETTFYDEEVVIYTALHNEAAGGDEPLLFDKDEKETDEWDIAFVSEGASLK